MFKKLQKNAAKNCAACREKCRVCYAFLISTIKNFDFVRQSATPQKQSLPVKN